MASDFDPKAHLIQIKSGQTSNDYLPVCWRLVWFREKFPNGSIETEMVHLDLDRDTQEEAWVWNNEKRKSEKIIKHAQGIAIFKATVKDGLGGIATGTKMEKAASFPDWLEKAETGAVGRALAELGFGTQFTGDEFNESHRIVDSPIARTTPAQAETNSGSPALASTPESDTPMTSEQFTSIRKLYQRLGKTEPDSIAALNKMQAQKLIKELSTEFNTSKQSSRAS